MTGVRKKLKLSLETQKLIELLKDFHTLTGMRLVIFDADYQEILAYPESHCSFCEVMHSNKQTGSYCRESNEKSFAHCRKSGELMVYRCHAGLIEATAPLKDNGVIIGYTMFGQLTDIEDSAVLLCSIHENCQTYQLETKLDDTVIMSITYKNHEQIKAAAKIMEACTFYVLHKDMLHMEKQQFMHKLNEYILAHMSETISVENLCDIFQISRSKLYEVSNQYLGMGIAEYIKQKRIEQAKEYLKDSNDSITRISQKVGFADYNYFCRTFKKKVGLPTKKYRKQYQQDASEN